MTGLPSLTGWRLMLEGAALATLAVAAGASVFCFSSCF